MERRAVLMGFASQAYVASVLALSRFCRFASANFAPRACAAALRSIRRNCPSIPPPVAVLWCSTRCPVDSQRSPLQGSRRTLRQPRGALRCYARPTRLPVANPKRAMRILPTLRRPASKLTHLRRVRRVNHMQGSVKCYNTATSGAITDSSSWIRASNGVYVLMHNPRR